MPLLAPHNVRRQVRLLVHRVCMDRHRHGEGACELETELNRLFISAGGLERPEDAELRRWIEEDEADFDRALLISELLAESEPRIVIPPVSGSVVAGSSARTAEPTRSAPPASRQPERPPRPAGPPSIADLLDGMFAQQARR